MNKIIADLVTRFDEGRLSRRHLLQGLSALAAAGSTLPARAQETPFESARIDHVSIQVTDLPRAVEFYQRIFGLSVLDEDDENQIVRMGVTSVIVSLHAKAPTGIVDHFAIAIDGFDREQVTRDESRLRVLRSGS
jgi:hypothetical protein